MNNNLDRLYELLPVIYRQRDAEQGQQLQTLLHVIAEQMKVVEDDISQLYENWFIETCQDWVVPYIGDLVGYQVVHEAGEPGEVTTVEGQLRNKILIPRRDVAHTIRDRRAKGTLALLEQLAMDAAGWPARAVEFYTLLGCFQNINSLHLKRGRTVDLRDGDALDRIDGPFDELAHTVDVRRIVSHRSIGRFNIPSVGLFVWRLKVYSVTNTRARHKRELGQGAFTFSILGNDSPLYTKPIPKPDSQRFSDELNFPAAILRRNFERDVKRAQDQKKPVSDYYGEEKSLFIWTARVEQAQQPGSQQQEHSQRTSGGWEPVTLDRIIAADLTDWQYQPEEDKVAVDPVLGRIAFAPNYGPRGGLRVLYHYAFSADIGGGEYNRPLFQPAKYKLFNVSKESDINSIEKALEEWKKWKARNPPSDPDNPEPRHAIIEITDSGVYIERQLSISLGKNESLQIRAANRKRPVIDLTEVKPDRTGSLVLQGITGTAGSRLTLDGLLIFGWEIEITGPLAELAIRHCTLVPGWDLESDCIPKRADQPGLTLTNTDACVIIEHSILGSIEVNKDEVRQEPISIKISDSILDAANNEEALSTSDRPKRIAHAKLATLRTTVLGKILVHAIELAENSIFTGLVRVARSQVGCMRFCYVPDESRTPRRYNCQPDLVKQAVDRDDTIPATEKAAERQHEIDRVEPVFNSVHYGIPTYCQLADACADEIKRGADDESEMGVFHDLFQLQRAANLRARLDEYTPAGMEAGIIYVN
jgi:hypothetical protein